jgi:hypothetical protein
MVRIENHVDTQLLPNHIHITAGTMIGHFMSFSTITKPESIAAQPAGAPASSSCHSGQKVPHPQLQWKAPTVLVLDCSRGL